MSDTRPDKRSREVDELRQQLEEAKETLRAITSGEVDALVVNTTLGEQVFTLQGADTVYRIAIENINEGAIALSAEGTILFSNHYFARMMRSDLKNMIGASIYDFVNPKNRGIVDEMLRLEADRREINLRCADGNYIPTYVATRKLLIDTPTISAVVTDLTQQKRSEEIVRKGRVMQAIDRVLRKYLTSDTMEEIGEFCLEVAEELTESELGFIAEVKSDGLLQTIAISKIGWETCTMIDKAGHRMLPDYFKVRGLYGQVLLNGESLLTNNPPGHPQSGGTPAGHPPLKNFLGVPLKYQDRTIGVLALANRKGGYRPEEREAIEALAPAIAEIIMHKKAEEATKESEERFRAIADNTPDHILVQDADLRYTFVVNPQIGFTEKDMLGKTDYELLSKEDAERLTRIKRQVIDTGKPVGLEESAVNKTGQLEYFSGSYIPRFNREGKVDGLIGYFRNITERKKNEERLKRYAHELESANKELESFSYSVSHDLRAPLRTMDGFSEILVQEYGDRLDQTGNDYLNRIRNASQNMAQLIDDIAKLSRITRAETVLEEVNLSEMVRSVLNELKAGQPERLTEFDIAPEIKATADRQLIHILMQNLLGNAWKFTSKCPLTKIEFGELVLRGKRTYFIKDNGAGFDMRYAERLFKPFQRLHSDKDYSGTGIGLAIVQSVILRHRGSVWAESEPGKGATFFFTLP